jgi:hypothetical protein
VDHEFRLLASHDRSRYMVLQPHPLVFMWDLTCDFSVCLTCVDGHIFSHSMITHEPFVSFDGFFDSLSCGLGRVRGHVFRASLLVHDFVLVIFFFVLLMLVP